MSKPTNEQLKRINFFTRRELAADEVFVFSIMLADNEVDRDYERFSTESLKILGDLLVGKTGVFDHSPYAENQCARIFEAWVISEERLNSIGEQYHCLKAWAYMVRCDKNADLILGIDAGVKKEVSVGCAIERLMCSICGMNQKITPCEHIKGTQYAVHGFYGKKYATCHHRLENPTDAYEWSFIAVPAQKIRNHTVVKVRKVRYGICGDMA